MPPPVTRIYDLAVDVLAAIVDHWPDGATALPDMRFVSNGSPFVQDGCEFVGVAVERTFSLEGDIAFEQITAKGAGFANRAASIVIGVIRCIPTIDGRRLPTAAETEASAAVILSDAEAVFQAILIGHRLGEISGCGGMAYEAWSQEIPQGGMGGGTLRIRVFLQ